jgi:hypothetical protein
MIKYTAVGNLSSLLSFGEINIRDFEGDNERQKTKRAEPEIERNKKFSRLKGTQGGTGIIQKEQPITRNQTNRDCRRIVT